MRGVVFASTRCVSRSGAAPQPLPDHPADRQPAERKRPQAERIGDRQRVAAELFDRVFAGRRIAGAVAAQVVAQHLEVPLEIRGLRIPHPVVEPERVRQHHHRPAGRAGQAVVVTNAVSDKRAWSFYSSGRSAASVRIVLGRAQIVARDVDVVQQTARGPRLPSVALSASANGTPLPRLCATALGHQLLRAVAAERRRQQHHRALGEHRPPVASRFAASAPDRRRGPRRRRQRATAAPVACTAALTIGHSAWMPPTRARAPAPSPSGTPPPAPASASPPPAPPRSPTGSASAASSTIRRPARQLHRLRPASAAKCRARPCRAPRRTARRPSPPRRADRDRCATAARTAGRARAPSPRRPAGPDSPSAASVPAAPPNWITSASSQASSRRRQLRAIAAVQPATFRPNVIGVAGCSSVRPSITVAACRSDSAPQRTIEPCVIRGDR